MSCQIHFSCRKKTFNVAVSVNVAYEDVVLEAEHNEEPKVEHYYENLDDIMKSSRQQPDNEAVAACRTTDPNASEHISVEETM